jgi:hypothetical protein
MNNSLELNPKPPKPKKISGPEAKILRQLAWVCSCVVIFMLLLDITGHRTLLPWPSLRWLQIFAQVLVIVVLSAIAIFIFRTTSNK